MRIAGSIITGVIGAILYFAVSIDLAGVSLPTVGLILLIAAAVWFTVEVGRGLAGDRVTTTSTVSDGSGVVQQRQTEVRETNVSEPV